MALESKLKNCVVSEMVSKTLLPPMIPVKQNMDKSHIPVEEIAGIVRDGLLNGFLQQKVKQGMRVAISCGSRGVSNIAVITKAIADTVYETGGKPFIFPAMGSHGGATAQGQTEVLLHQFGITEETMGCPILSAMDVIEVGETPNGLKVFADKNAAEADAIILCNRIKAHTAFESAYESGIIKMAVIGMGKQHGAETVHNAGFVHMGNLLPQFAKVLFENTKIIGGIGLIENAFNQTCKIAILDKDEIFDKEPELLLEAKQRMGHILLDNLDVLVVDRIGKNISGDGMDPHVTGRFAVPEAINGKSKAQRLAVLDLTDESRGNCLGIGLADVTTKRLIDKYNIDYTYPNAVTSTVLNVCKVPIFACSDKACIQLALQTCNGINMLNPRVVRISDTLNLENIWISPALLEEAGSHPLIEIVGEQQKWSFDSSGNLW